MKKGKVFASWSGGKDGCFACYRAAGSGLKVRYLLNMVTEDGKRSWSHGLSTGVLQVQSQAIGIPLIQQRTTQDKYEAAFRETLLGFKPEGIDAGVFGHIDFEPHRQWDEEMCRQAGITAHLPLWGQNQDGIIRDFIAAGFEAVVVAPRAGLLGEEGLGQRVDRDFLGRLHAVGKGITPCGEAGEYHTLVIDGPLFGRRVEILESGKVLREGHWFLEITKCGLGPKR